MWVFLILVGVPVIEIGLFIQLGGILGLWPTLAIVVLTALIGSALLRTQGLSTLEELKRTAETGQSPAGQRGPHFRSRHSTAHAGVFY